MTHGEWADRINDRNGDGFQDNALSKDLVLRVNWKYVGDRGLRGEYAVTAVFAGKAGRAIAACLMRVVRFVDGGPAGGPLVASAKTGLCFSQ